eukprot:646639-Pelagomonas_calceolata.AAC.5
MIASRNLGASKTKQKTSLLARPHDIVAGVVDKAYLSDQPESSLFACSGLAAAKAPSRAIGLLHAALSDLSPNSLPTSLHVLFPMSSMLL